MGKLARVTYMQYMSAQGQFIIIIPAFLYVSDHCEHLFVEISFSLWGAHWSDIFAIYVTPARKCWLHRNYNLLFVKDTSISKRTSFLVNAKPLTICKRNIIIIVCETILPEVREHMFSSLGVWRNSSRYRGPIWMTSSSLPWWRHQMEIFSA